MTVQMLVLLMKRTGDQTPDQLHPVITLSNPTGPAGAGVALAVCLPECHGCPIDGDR